MNPDAARIREGLGSLLLQMPGRRQEAITQLESALHLAPGSRNLQDSLAAAWFDEGMTKAQFAGQEDEVIAAYQRALELNPDFLEAHFNLGNVLLRTPGRRDDAVVHYEAAIRLEPDFAEAHTNLGTILVGQPGRLDDAIAHFEAALRAKPDFAPAQRNLERARQLRE